MFLEDCKYGNSNIYELFHSGVVLNCKIYNFKHPFSKKEYEHYWVTNGSSLEIYNSKKVLIRSLNIFANRATKIKISGLKLLEDINKVIIWGRNAFVVLDIEKDLYDFNISNINMETTKSDESVDILQDYLETIDVNSNDVFRHTITDLESRENSINNWITDAEYKDNYAYLLTSSNEVVVWDTVLNKRERLVELKNIKSISYKGTLSLNDSKLIVVSPTITAGCHIWTIDISCKLKTEYLYKLDDDSCNGIIFDSQIDRDYRHLVICSDDRSINLYDFKTGKLINKIYGHQARVWSVRFVYDNLKNAYGIISCSEDCRFILWKFANGFKDLTKQETHEVTQIKNCWSLDYKNDKVLTCGNDGRVKLTQVFVNRSDDSVFSCQLVLKKKENLKDVIKCGKTFIALSNTGSIFASHNFGTFNIVQMGALFTDSLTKLISVNENFFLAIDTCNKIILFDVKNGSIQFKFSFVVEEIVKILSLQIVLLSNQLVYFMIDTPNKNDCILLYSLDLIEYKFSLSFSYPKLQKNMKQAFNISSAVLSLSSKKLIVGTLSGKVLFFNIEEKEAYKVISFDYNNESIVRIKATQDSYKGKPLFLVCSKTHYSIMTEDIFIMTNNSSLRIDEADYNSQEGVILYGIKDSHYVQQHEKNNNIMDQFDLKQYNQVIKNELGWCGTITKEDNNIVKINIKIFDIDMPNNSIICEGTHGREIRSLSILNKLDEQNCMHFITGSEDTTIKHYKILIKENTDSLNKFSCKTIDAFRQGRLKYGVIALKQQMTYRAHVSGIQTTDVIYCGSKLANSKYLVTTSAKEELFLWKSFISDQGTHSLAIVGILPTTKELKGKDVTAELRITSFCYDSSNELLFTCYSNSMIRSWKLEKKQNSKVEFTLNEEIFYKNCSIFDCVLVDGMFVIGSSDGKITSYAINKDSLLTLRDSITIHQSGIMSMETLGIDNIVTGGDDNSIVLTEINKHGAFNFKSKIVNAANSAITDIKSLNNSQFAYISTDQIFAIGCINKFKDLSLQMSNSKAVQRELINVADTQSIDISGNFCMIGGLGMSLFEIPSNVAV
ncbi:hypothetical protein QEN19_000519 [Hanseniaspora menglaensis]